VIQMYSKTWTFRETSLLIKCDDEQAIEAGLRAGISARNEIERYVLRYPEFFSSLEPVKLEGNHPKVIETMLDAGERAGVGPFAAVAGAISQVVADAIRRAGAQNVVVDNGGDIAIIGRRDFRVGVFAGDGFGRIGFHITAGELPLGICTSSGTVGHSLSLGMADAVVAVASEASVADAAATSIGNSVRGSDVPSSIEQGLEQAKHIDGIKGCLIIRKKHVGTWGKIPKLIQVSPGSRKILDVQKKYRSYDLGDSFR